MPADAFVVSCEHGGNRIPEPWTRIFLGREEELESHRGWDPGALPLATLLARTLDAPLYAVTVSRLLCDTNRREGHPRLFGRPVRELSGTERERILAEYHRPHRNAVGDEVAAIAAGRERAVHLSIHTFTPVLDGGVPRSTEVGLLYDPSREAERRLCARWAEALLHLRPGLRVHRNRPYRGRSDGLTRSLRERFPPEAYLGIEVEVRADLLVPDGAGRHTVRGRGGPARVAADRWAAILLDGLATACAEGAGTAPPRTRGRSRG